LDLEGTIGMLLARCPVEVVERGMTGLATLQMVSLVIQPSSTIMTCQRQFLGSRHPRKMVFTIKGDLATCFVEKYLAPCITQDSY
jgi:hypothetical protein